MPYKRSGGKQCVVVGCVNNQKKLYEWENSCCEVHGIEHKECPCLMPFKLHYMPTNDEKRRAWIKSLNRKDFNPTSQPVVCSKHFADGRPTKVNPYPTINMGYTPQKMTPARRPLVKKSLNTPAKQSSQPVSESHQSEDSEEFMFTATPLKTLTEESTYAEESTFFDQCESVCCTLNPETCQNKPKMVDSSTQTVDVVFHDHNYWYSKPTRNAACQQSTSDFSLENVSTDSDAKFHTGLSLAVLLAVVSTLSQYGKGLPYKLAVGDQILAVLVRLRLGLTLGDLSRRLHVSTQLMSRIFNDWIIIMAEHLSDLVFWMSRETIRRNLPKSFQASFPHTTCIIDCSEVFLQRPFSLKARAQTYSTYKSHNTVKFLIAIAPDGFIMYVSPLYGGRASDNFITKNCGFLDYLLPGDEVMADRGFTIGEELCARQVKLNIPAFMKGRKQLSEQEVIETRRIASVRIHVERAIMRMKSYRFLNTKLPIKSVKTMNAIVRVVAALCNARHYLIQDELDDN